MTITLSVLEYTFAVVGLVLLALILSAIIGCILVYGGLAMTRFCKESDDLGPIYIQIGSVTLMVVILFISSLAMIISQMSTIQVVN